MQAHRRRILATIGLITGSLALATTVSLGGAAAVRKRAVAAAPPCVTAGLDIWLSTAGSGTAGSSYFDLELTNLTDRSCTLTGYPGVSAVSLAGRQLGSPALRDTAHAASTVTLASLDGAAGLPPVGTDATATVVLEITDVGAFPPSSCGQVTAAGLRVYPPAQRGAEIVPFPFVACSRPGPLYLQVEAVQKGPPVAATAQTTYQPFAGSHVDPSLEVTGRSSGACSRYGGGAAGRYYYRCGATQPCFAGPGGPGDPLVCPAQQDPTTGGVVLWTATSVDTSGFPPARSKTPWAMQLTNGAVCSFVAAAWSGLGPFACGRTGPSRLADCRAPVQAVPYWTARCQARTTDTSPFSSQAVAQVWF